MSSAELQLRNDVAWREIGGQIVAMDVRTAHCMELNRTGTRLWRELVDGTTIDLLTAVLVNAFGIDQGAARRDVDTFVEALCARRLLEADVDAHLPDA